MTAAQVQHVQLAAEGSTTAVLGDWHIEHRRHQVGDHPGVESAARALRERPCRASHLGYLFSGSFIVLTLDGGSTTIKAGEAYRIEPGHAFGALEDLEYLEFTPAPEKAAAGPP